MSNLKAQVDRLLTVASSGFFPKEFISEKILPEIKVKAYSGLLGKYGNSHLRIENSIKGGRGKYRRVEAITRSTASYLIEGHGLEGMVTKEDYANVEQPYDAEKDETNGISTMLFLEKEKLLADTLADTAIMTQNVTLSGTSQLSDYNNSDPVGVAATARAAIIGATGFAPNVAIMDLLVWNKIRFHPQLLDALGFKYATPGGLSEQQVAQALGVDKILYGQARYETAKEGQASSLAAVWGKHLVFAVAPERAETMQTSLGYMVRPTGSEPRKVYKQPAFNPPGATMILVEDEYDMLISNAAAGYLVKNAIA
jgi:hypothetical protein